MPEYINPYKLFHGSFVPNWLLERKEVSQGAKLCYARLCQYAGKKGTAWPAQETLAAEIGCSDREARRYLKELVTTELIEVEQRGLGKSNVYHFLGHPWILAAPDRTDMSALDRTDMSYKENQGRESRGSEPPRQSEIDSSSPPRAASPAAFFDAHGINEQVAVLVDIAKGCGRIVRGGRIAGILKRHQENKTAVMVAFMEAIARNVAVIEDYTEGVLGNEVNRRRDQPLETDGGTGSRRQPVAQGVSEIITEEEARRLIAARASAEGGGGAGVDTTPDAERPVRER